LNKAAADRAHKKAPRRGREIPQPPDRTAVNGNGRRAPNRAPNGEFYVWLEPKYVDRLRAMRKPRESYSDVIVRLAEASEGA
jgi:hypothetical protein